MSNVSSGCKCAETPAQSVIQRTYVNMVATGMTKR
jgi:hypothetical protein